MISTSIRGLSLLAAMLVAGAANAGPIYEYNSAASSSFGGNSGGAYDSIYGSYNTNTQDFVWEVDYTNTAAAGGWLVVSQGPNPKTAADQLAILYFDQASGDAWAYAYNGLNNSASYTQTSMLGYFQNAYSTVGDVATLALNAAGINGALNGSGLSFGSSIGVWFHPAYSLAATGDGNGLTNFFAQQTGWYDTSNDGGKCKATDTWHGGCVTVPEPSVLVLLGSGLLGVALLRRRRRILS